MCLRAIRHLIEQSIPAAAWCDVVPNVRELVAVLGVPHGVRDWGKGLDLAALFRPLITEYLRLGGPQLV
jgi:hypothetical protein